MRYKPRSDESKMSSAVKRYWKYTIVSDSSDGCWGWRPKFRRPKGYVTLSVIGKSVSIHRFSWELHNGPVPDGLHVLHKCDNPECSNPGHLFLGTNLDNIMDKISKNRQAQGEGHAFAKMTWERVMVAREIYQRITRDLALEFGVTANNIREILENKTWKNPPANYQTTSDKRRYKSLRCPM